MRSFGYLRDPVFAASVAVYALNQLWWKPAGAPAPLQNWLNDFLLIPCALPVLLRLHRAFGWRDHDSSPTWSEIGLHVLVWSICCEGIGPMFIPWASGDPVDVLAYGLGALLAGALWNSAWRCNDGRLRPSAR